METEPRAATRVETFLIAVALVGLALSAIGWQLWTLRHSTDDFEPTSIFEKRLPPIPKHDFQPLAPISALSDDGLRAAALAQIIEAQHFGRDEWTEIWSYPECRTWDILALTSFASVGKVSLYDMVVVDVVVENFDGRAGSVRVMFREASGKTQIRNEAGRAERWEYRDGAWTNLTCQYSEGPSTLQMIRDGTIRLSDVNPK